ncbi:MAG: class II SORL domain-containing protein [Actinomycetota bacterium]|nr:class II SORL domain-containing protein [Actinomycetota bacterium]
MTELNELLQSSDFKIEKHVPVIEAIDTAQKGEQITVIVGVGKEIEHPNTTQHHIAWITLYFLPDGEKYPIQIGKLTFSAHGSSVQGADTSTVYTNHRGTLMFKTEKPGTLLASSYCNIHGLWQSCKRLDISG